MIVGTIESDLAYRTGLSCNHPHRLFNLLVKLFLEQLSKMKLLPRFYGQEISSVFKQKYYGHITMVPHMRWSETFGKLFLVLVCTKLIVFVYRVAGGA